MTKSLRQACAAGMGLTLSVGSAVVLGAGALVLGAGTAQAVTSPVPTYSCPAPVVGPQDSTTSYDSDLPDSIPAGSDPMLVKIASKGVAKASATGQAWSLLGARKMTAITDAPITIGAGTIAVKKTVRMTGPTVPINNGGDTFLDADGEWGMWTPPEVPAEVPVTLDSSYYTSVHLLKGDGSHTSMSPQNTTCTVKANQNRVMDTVLVTANSTTSVGAVATEITEGDGLEVSADVSVTAGKAAGKVEFKVGDGPNQKLLVNVVNGKASGVISGLEAGGYQLSATFVPTQPRIYLASASAETSITVSPVVPATPTTTTMSLDRAMATTDQEVKATVTVTSTGGNPEGQARVVVNGKPYSAPLVSGSAVVTVPPQRAGTHPIQASFVPANAKLFAPSSSASSSLLVTAGAGGDLKETSTFVSFGKTSWDYGTTTSVTAQVTAPGVAAAGRVDFEFDDRKIYAPVVNGRAVVSLPYLPVGTYRLTAAFVPNSGFASSTADPVAFSVTKKGATPPVGGLRSSAVTVSVPSLVRVGTNATVRASVRIQGGAAAQGKVLFAYNGTTLPVTVSKGVAVASVPVRSRGIAAISARYEPSDPTSQRSSVGAAVLRGYRAVTRTKVSAKAAGKKVTVQVRTTSGGSTCSVPVTITLKKGAVTKKAVVKASCTGQAKAAWKVKTGAWKARATFAGNGAASASSGSARVLVK